MGALRVHRINIGLTILYKKIEDLGELTDAGIPYGYTRGRVFRSSLAAFLRCSDLSSKIWA